MRFGLKSRITLAILGLICLLVPILSGVLYAQFTSSMEATRQSNVATMASALLAQAGKRGIGIAGLLAESITNPFYHYRFDEVRVLVESAATQRGIVSAYVFDEKARIVSDGTKTLDNFGKRLESPQVVDVLESGGPQTRVEGDILFAYVPVRVGSQVLGGVRLGVSLADIQSDIEMASEALDGIDAHGRESIFAATGVVTLAFLVIGILLAAIIARGINGPIELLVRLTRRIGRGESDVESPVSRKDEIGELASALCQMAKSRKTAEDEARRLQADIAHFSRVAAVGEMATSLAHELNQPLAAISNFVRGCTLRLKDARDVDPRVVEAMDKAAEQAYRAGKIIHRVREFVQKKSLDHQVFDINETIRETVELNRLEANWKEVRITLDLYPELPPIRADRIQIQQVVFNLIRNAIDALDEMPPHRKTVLVSSSLRDTGEVRVCVRDSGTGIRPELQEGLFDPFVTSKSDGLGMGLPICRSIIESHAGTLRLDETGPSGTTFSFSLKRVDDLAAHTEKSVPA